MEEAVHECVPELPIVASVARTLVIYTLFTVVIGKFVK